METYEIILNQLGGNRFIVMTGCHHFAYDSNSLSMTLRKNKSKANKLKIELTHMDTYNMVFTRQTNGHFTKNYNWIDGKTEVIKKLDGIYCDQLQEIFTETTGLYTHF